MPTSGRHLERLLSLDGLLRSRGCWTAQALADALEVSERTVRGDISFLRDRLGASIGWSRQQGYFYEDPDWRLPTVSLTEDELLHLLLAAQMLSTYSNAAYQSDLENATDQLMRRLPDRTRQEMERQLRENLLIRPGPLLNLDPEILQNLEQACRENNRVRMRYSTPGKEESERTLDPYVLHFTGTNPYVTGFCHQRQALRSFRVDRIRHLQLMQERFEVPAEFDPDAYFADTFQHEVGGKPQAIAIRFDAASAPYIRERRWHPSQEIEELADGALVLRLMTKGLNELKRWVLFYGAGAQVLEPPALVELLESELAGMLALYPNLRTGAREADA